MQFKILLLALCCILTSSHVAAQSPQEVTLTVSSDGPTKEEATKNALRSAIEQAFGVFVSANTSMLDDEIVKDEIVTVSNGSIKEFKELSAVQTSAGNYLVTLSATVSLSKLITYAKSHGNECEFAGSTLAMNDKIRQLQIENAQKAIDNLKSIVDNTNFTFDYDLELEEPKLKGDRYHIPAILYIYATGNTIETIAMVDKTIEEIAIQTGGGEITNRRRPLHPYYSTLQVNRYGLRWGIPMPSILQDQAIKFQINDNLSSPSNIEITPCDLQDFWGPQMVYYYHTYQDAKKPYNWEKFEKHCKQAKNEMIKQILKRHSRDKHRDLNSDFPISYRIVKFDNQWSVKVIQYAFPLFYTTFELSIPREDIGKYSKFWIAPKQ